MKLTWRILLHISLLLLIVLPLWSLFFYKAILKEVNDETDDNLELYAEQIIRRQLSNPDMPLPDGMATANNTYRIEKAASSAPGDLCEYSNEMVYIPAKEETEPARVLRMSFSDRNGDTYLLTVMTPTLESEDLVRAIVDWILLLFGGLLLTIVAIVSVVIGRSMRPLKRLLTWIGNYRLGEDSTPLNNPTTISEFRQLNEATTELAARNEKLYSQQKEFIGNASHEIQTPIAVCQNRMELLCNKNLSEEQMAEAVKTRRTLEYISRLNKSLLFLTKIENRQFPEREPVAIGALIDRCLEDYTEIYAHKQLHVVRIPDSQPEVVEMNRTLATALLSNLIRNAFTHNIENGSITISYSGRRFTIANTGQAEPLDRNHLFERFRHTARKEGSTGLGLSIVESIATSYGLEVTYNYIENRHEFSVNFANLR